MNAFCKIILGLVLISAGFCWLYLLSGWIYEPYRDDRARCIMIALPAVIANIGFLIMLSSFPGEKFLSFRPIGLPFRKRILSYFVDIVSGVLLALGFYFILAFLSPPLPFVPSISCATGYNDVTYLFISAFFFGLRYYIRKKLKVDPGNPIPITSKDT